MTGRASRTKIIVFLPMADKPRNCTFTMHRAPMGNPPPAITPTEVAQVERTWPRVTTGDTRFDESAAVRFFNDEDWPRRPGAPTAPQSEVPR